MSVMSPTGPTNEAPSCLVINVERVGNMAPSYEEKGDHVGATS